MPKSGKRRKKKAEEIAAPADDSVATATEVAGEAVADEADAGEVDAAKLAEVAAEALPAALTFNDDIDAQIAELIAESIEKLVKLGRDRGVLTYREMNDILPDEDISPEKIDEILVLLDEQGIELVDKMETPELGFEAATEKAGFEEVADADIDDQIARAAEGR